MKNFPILCMAGSLALASLAGTSAFAQSLHSHSTRVASTSPPPGAAATGASEMADGEVRRIDRERGTLTLRHGVIKSLDMPAMTMVFIARDKAMLDQVKVGDKVRFRATNDGGKLMVVEIAPAS